MAQKTSGNINFPFNFNVQLEGPIDARATVEAYADLASVPQKYDGMIVSVVDDADPELVGVYYYLDSSDTWTKVGTGAANALGDLTDVDLSGASNGNVIKYNSGTGNWEPGNDNNTNQLLWRTINADNGSTSANSTADTLTIAGGTDITTTIVGDTVTIDYGGSGGSATKISDGFYNVETINHTGFTSWDGGIKFQVPEHVIVEQALKPNASVTAWEIQGNQGVENSEYAGHLIPGQNAVYDIGSAEKKVRHLYLSTNSLWLGDSHKISIDETTEEMQFLKRDKTVLPPKLAERGETIESVKTRFGKANLSDVKLGEWDILAREQGFKLEEVYDIQEASVWQKQKSLDALEKGDRIERVPPIDVDASAGNIDLTDRIANSATGILIIYNSDNEIKLDLGVLTKTVSTEPYEFYSADQGPITIVTGGAQVYSIFDRSSENVIRCESGQFIKFWFNRSRNRFEYIYRSL